MDLLTTIATWLVPLVIAIVFHEVAHGLVARRLGDPTAARMGRLTLNPFKHIDPFGTVILPMALAIAKAPVFGWARPVPVIKERLRNPRRDMILVALAGPGMNFLLALVATMIIGVTVALSDGQPTATLEFIFRNAVNFLLINIFLAVFNLIPLPPFDGGHVVEGLLPPPLAKQFAALGRYAIFVLIFLLLILPMLSPSANIVERLIAPIVDSIARYFLGLAGATG
jgi:Zn-dependent protease